VLRSVVMDSSMNTKFSTQSLITEFQTTFRGVYHQWNRSHFDYERYVLVELPKHCPFPIFFGATEATHIGFRGCYEWRKPLGFGTDTELKTEQACLVLFANEMRLSGTEIRLKNIEQFRAVFQSILRESGASNADYYVKIIRELKSIVKEILEKNPDAFTRST
jgi:hypothetical protein